MAVTHVCGYWREVGLDMATLWADAVCAFPSVFVADELLERARDYLLNIEVRHTFDELVFKHRRQWLPIRWGTQQLHRAHSFNCHIHRWSTFNREHPAAYITLTNPLLVLQHLNLVCNTTFKTEPTPVIEPKAPALASASLWDILPHPSSSASALRRLTLHLGSRMPIKDMSPVLSALRGLHGLEYLDLFIRADGTSACGGS